MKKALCIIMALVLLCGTLVACNNVTDDNSGDVSSTVSDAEYELFSNLPEVNYAESGKNAEKAQKMPVFTHFLSPELYKICILYNWQFRFALPCHEGFI